MLNRAALPPFRPSRRPPNHLWQHAPEAPANAHCSPGMCCKPAAVQAGAATFVRQSAGGWLMGWVPAARPHLCSAFHAPQPIGAMRVRVVLLAAAAALLLAAGAEARRCRQADYECTSKRRVQELREQPPGRRGAHMRGAALESSSSARGPSAARRSETCTGEGAQRSQPAQPSSAKGGRRRRPPPGQGREDCAPLHRTQICGPIAGAPARLVAGTAPWKQQRCRTAAEQPWVPPGCRGAARSFSCCDCRPCSPVVLFRNCCCAGPSAWMARRWCVQNFVK